MTIRTPDPSSTSISASELPPRGAHGHKVKAIAVRMTEREYVALERLASADDRTLSSFVRKLLTDRLRALGTDEDAAMPA
jgi:hypothetical protein